MSVGNLDLRKRIQRSNGTPARPLIEELWARDSMGVTAAMKATDSIDPDHSYLDASEEDIPEVGDRITFEVGTKLCATKSSSSSIRCSWGEGK